MLKIRNPVYIFSLLIIIFASLFVGCDSKKNEEAKGKVMSLTEVLKSELSSVDGIDVQFGDGNKMEITDAKTIQDIVSQIKSIKVRETKSKGVGYLYYLDLKQGDKTYRFSSDLTIDGKSYEAIDNTAEKLNDFMVKMGRDQIPGLLPGVNSP
jgi:hypothetical protein